MLLSIPAVVLVTLFLLLPGVVWAWWCYPAPHPVTRLAVGLALGVAYQMHVCALLAVGPGITGESVALATLAALIVAALLAWRVPHPRIPRISGKSARRSWTEGAQIACLLAVITAVRLVPLAWQQVPQGWDPSFHSLLASTTVATGRLPTWSPFEPIPSNYPYGPHVLMAEISLLSGIAPHIAFAGLLDGLLPLLTGLALYAFARSALRGHAPALAAVAAYGLLGFWGSIDYGSWGGLPNALGCFMLIAFLAVLFAPGIELVRVLVGGILLGAIPLAHHHVMLTTVLLLVVYGAYLIWRAFLSHRISTTARRQSRRALRRLVLSGAVGFATVAYYIVPFAARARELPDTSVLRYYDVAPGWIPGDNGWALWLLAIAGAPLLDPRVRRMVGGALGRARAFVTIASATLLVAFLVCYYGYRTYSLHVYNQPYTAFTPTRFLTDLTLFLSIYAAGPLTALWRLGSRDGWKAPARAEIGSVRPAWRTLRRWGVRAALLLICAATAVLNLAPQLGTGDGQLAPGEADAFAWIRAHTTSDTFVFNLDPNARWAPYFTQREVLQTPVPISEFTVGAVAEKRYLGAALLQLLADKPATPVMAALSTGDELPALLNRPAAVLDNRVVPGMPNAPAFVSGPERVYLMPDAFSYLLPDAVAADTSVVRWWPSLASPPPGGWAALGAPVEGWIDGPPRGTAASPAIYARVELLGALQPGARYTCQAEGAVTLYVDGQAQAQACDGAWHTVPDALVAAGPHVIAVRAEPGQGIGRWFDLFLADGAQQ